MTDYSELKKKAECATGFTDMGLAPDVVLELIAEVEHFRAVAEQPASLHASPAADYEGLKRQFFALRNYALCKDKLSGYYSRELESMRRVDRSLSAGEIDAERNINQQLTNDLLCAEATIETLRKGADRYAVLRKGHLGGELCIYANYENTRTGMRVRIDGEQLDAIVDGAMSKEG